MAEISQRDQLALHEFSVRYREGFNKANPAPEHNITSVKDALRDQYSQEQHAQKGLGLDGPSHDADRDKQPEEQDAER